MQLTGIDLQNYLAHRHLNLPLAPMTIVAGPNGAGKSTIPDAIGFALLAELRRVELKGERAALVSDGATKGKVTVTIGEKALSRDVTTGKMHLSGDGPLFPVDVATVALAYVLDPPRFSRLPADERRTVLYSVMGVSTSPIAILKTLEERGHTDAVLRPLREMKDGSVSKWLALAERSATEDRGAWRGVTAEAYGAQKAEIWSAPVPSEVATDEELAGLEERAAELPGIIGGKQRELGAIEAKLETATAQAARTAELRRKVAMLPTLRQDLERALSRLESTHERVEDARKVKEGIDARAAEAYQTCPHCRGHVIQQRVGGPLVPYAPPERPATKTDLDTAADALAGARVEHRKAEEAHTAAVQALSEAESAEKALAAVEDIPAGELPTQRTAAAHELTEYQAELEEVQSQLRTKRDGRAAATRAAESTRRAAELHQSVKRWTELAAALSPDGIPGELLAKALQPINDTLRNLAGGSKWPQVSVAGDMAITAAGRPLGLLSESERWRADVQLAIALAIHSGLRMVILDRFDLLDVPSRRPALSWLYGLVTGGQLDSCLVLGTLKEPPKVPAAVKVHWLDGARVPAEAAA